MINSKEIYVYPAERCHTFTKTNLQTVLKTASPFFKCFLNSVVRNIFDYLSIYFFKYTPYLTHVHLVTLIENMIHTTQTKAEGKEF